MAITKIKFAQKLADKMGVSKKQGLEWLDAFVDEVTKALRSGEKVNIPGLGEFSPGALIQMVKTDDNARVLSSPHILIANNEQADFTVGEVIFYKNSAQDAQTGALKDKVEKENVDLVILCGDLTYAEQSTEGIIGPFVKKNKKVILIPGNHESVATADFLAELYGATNLHGYSIKSHGVGLFGCGGANIGLFKLGEDEIYGLLKKGYDSIKDQPKKIMVTHVHPTGTKMEKFTHVFPGSKQNCCFAENKPCTHIA